MFPGRCGAPDYKIERLFGMRDCRDSSAIAAYDVPVL
jgi:hypothetical protein